MSDLAACTVNQLRAKFEEKFGRPATSRNKPYLIRKLGGNVPETAEHLARRLAGKGVPQREICAALEQAGIKTARGGSKWWPSSVQGLLAE